MELILIKILIQTNYKKNNFLRDGFSFIEVVIFISILTLVLGYVTPNFFSLFESQKDKELKHLSKVFKIIRTDAILKNKKFCIKFNVERQYMRVNSYDSGECKNLKEKSLPKWLKNHSFQEEFFLKDAGNILNNNRTENDNFFVIVDNSGFVTPFSLKFYEKDNKKTWIYQTTNLLGNLEEKK